VARLYGMDLDVVAAPSPLVAGTTR
jgi:hypothetical protein